MGWSTVLWEALQEGKSYNFLKVGQERYRAAAVLALQGDVAVVAVVTRKDGKQVLGSPVVITPDDVQDIKTIGTAAGGMTSKQWQPTAANLKKAQPYVDTFLAEMAQEQEEEQEEAS